MSSNQRGRNAAQLNIGGTGLGSFNDRFRDALMGGSPFAPPRYQGWATGLATQSNSFTQVPDIHGMLPAMYYLYIVPRKYMEPNSEMLCAAQ